MVKRWLGMPVLLLAVVTWSLPAAGRAPDVSPWWYLQREYLQASVHDPHLAAAQVVQWIDLAHAVEMSLAKR